MDKIRNFYDFYIEKLKIVSHDNKEYDFTSQMTEISFEESVFEQNLHGSLFAVDSVDFPSLLPIMGEERIKFSFTRQDELGSGYLDPIEIDLPIYNMSGNTTQNHVGSGKAQTYYLRYISEEQYTNANTKIYKKYRNMKYSEMVQRIYDEYLKTDDNSIEIEETSGEYSYYAQNVTPYRAIADIALRSISSEDNGYNYVFYRDRDGFKFTTLSKLAKQNPILTINYGVKNTPSSKYPRANFLTDLYSVDQYDKLIEFNTLESGSNGEACSALLSVDPVRRKFYLNAHDLRGDAGFNQHKIPLLQNSSWESYPHMNNSKTYIENSRRFFNPRSSIEMVITDYAHKDAQYITERDNDIYCSEPEFYLKQTKSHFKQMATNTIRVSLSGNPKVQAGSVINFLLPEVMSNVSEKKTPELDKYLQGRYLVTSVAHILSKQKYVMNIELVKDSYFSDIESRDPIEEYKFTY